LPTFREERLGRGCRNQDYRIRGPLFAVHQVTRRPRGGRSSDRLSLSRAFFAQMADNLYAHRWRNGPVTNLALAVTIDPQFSELVSIFRQSS
jgi:hypothetical protein